MKNKSENYNSDSEDPIIEEQVEQTDVRRNEDIETIRQTLLREYPSAVSAIEDYRKGYLTEQQLEIRFSQEEIEMIHRERDERDRADKETPTSGYL